jgi:hypothetical protein
MNTLFVEMEVELPRVTRIRHFSLLISDRKSDLNQLSLLLLDISSYLAVLVLLLFSLVILPQIDAREFGVLEIFFKQLGESTIAMTG